LPGARARAARPPQPPPPWPELDDFPAAGVIDLGLRMNAWAEPEFARLLAAALHWRRKYGPAALDEAREAGMLLLTGRLAPPQDG
jgi:hypothetical protein